MNLSGWYNKYYLILRLTSASPVGNGIAPRAPLPHTTTESTPFYFRQTEPCLDIKHQPEYDNGIVRGIEYQIRQIQRATHHAHLWHLAPVHVSYKKP